MAFRLRIKRFVIYSHGGPNKYPVPYSVLYSVPYPVPQKKSAQKKHNRSPRYVKLFFTKSLATLGFIYICKHLKAERKDAAQPKVFTLAGSSEEVVKNSAVCPA